MHLIKLPLVVSSGPDWALRGLRRVVEAEEPLSKSNAFTHEDDPPAIFQFSVDVPEGTIVHHFRVNTAGAYHGENTATKPARYLEVRIPGEEGQVLLLKRSYGCTKYPNDSYPNWGPEDSSAMETDATSFIMVLSSGGPEITGCCTVCGLVSLEAYGWFK